jgi:uncharacterized damage-inducible protein DinB
MKKHFTDLFEYNEWANQRILITLDEEESDDYQVLLLLSHLISAQIIWLNRILDIPTSPFPLWEKYKLRELHTMNEESTTNWLNFLKKHPNDTFEEMIFYKNSKEKKFESTLREIVTHVINHSTYHRAQIASILKQKQIQPPVTDYIAYCRMK